MNKLSKILIFVLLMLLGVIFIQNMILKHRVNKSVEQSGVLPDNVKQEVVVKKDKVTIKERVKDNVSGTETIESSTHYVPPEGKLVVTTTVDGNTSINLTNKGFTFTPGIMFVPSSQMNVGVGFRLVYYKKLGAGLGGIISIEDNPKPGAVGFVDYRIYNNFSIGIAYREAFTERGVGALVAYYF